jgi:hypothetical protein
LAIERKLYVNGARATSHTSLPVYEFVMDNTMPEEAKMGYHREEEDDVWADLAPEQPADRDRWLKWLATGAAILAILCLCSAGAFLVAREFLFAPTPLPIPAIPPLPGSVPTDSADTAQLPPPTAEQGTPVLIPTITPFGQPAEPPTVVGGVEASRLSATLVIDGVLSEWPGEPGYASAFRVFNAQDWDGTDDLTAIWQLAWDNINLYIGVEVTDDFHVQTQSGNQLFRGDSVDIQFDTDRAGDFGNGLSPDDFQITFSPGDFAALPASAFRFQGTDSGRILDAPGGHHATLAAQRNAAGYTLEAAVPWSDLNLAPAPGLVIGLALNANDNDTPGTAVQEVMKSHVSTRTLTDPSGWGTLTLR